MATTKVTLKATEVNAAIWEDFNPRVGLGPMEATALARLRASHTAGLGANVTAVDIELKLVGNAPAVVSFTVTHTNAIPGNPGGSLKAALK
jgi:hypothetical protein